MPTEKEKKKGSFFSGFLGKKLLGVKRKARAINTIDEIIKINNQTISIVFMEKSGARKAIVYECITADNCSEIIAKLNFLRVSKFFRFYFKSILEKSRETSNSKEKFLCSCCNN